MFSTGLLKECAKQLFKTDIQLRVISEDAFPKDEKYVDHVIAEVVVLSKSKTRRVTQGSRTDSGKLIARKKIRIGREEFQNMMPFGVSFDSKLQIKTAGIHILTLCPNVVSKSMRMTDVFQLLEPNIDFTYEKVIKTKINSFYLKFKQSANDEENEEDNTRKNGVLVLKGGYYRFLVFLLTNKNKSTFKLSLKKLSYKEKVLLETVSPPKTTKPKL